MTSSQARRDANAGLRRLGKCARCGNRLGRERGQHVAGVGICCTRCAGKTKTVT